MNIAEPTLIYQRAVTDLQPLLSAATVLRLNEPLSKRTTLRVGGPADLYIEPASEDDLARTVSYCTQHDIPWMTLGRGSNLLVRDGGIRGVVLCLAAPNFSTIDLTATEVRCGAGVRLRALA